MSRRSLLSLSGVIMSLAVADSAGATGLLVPTERSIGPLGIVYQRVEVEIQDQAAVTRVQQEFRNQTSRALEAYYLFPLPKDAGVQDFVMWIDGKKVKGEMVEAAQARKIYEDIVRRTQDPGLLEHMGNNLWRVRVFPVPAQGTQKIEITYSQVVPRDAGIAQYVYPLKTGNDTARTERDFTVRVELASQADIKSVYSPTHDVSVNRKGDHKAVVGFEANGYALNRDFHLYWTTSDKEVGLSVLTHRDEDDPGYFMMLLSPKVEQDKSARIARDIVFVADTSGSMKGKKIEQARNALKFCLDSLHEDDRFAVLGFSTTINSFESKLVKADRDNVKRAVKWVEDLSANGGTAIADALDAAMKLRATESRNFTVVFLTDGLPTIGETRPEKILDNVIKQNTDGTRIFSFGVGDDVNTHLLDQLAEKTRATSVYVRPEEDLEVKVSGFYAKISHPVLANLELSVGNDDVRLVEMYPPKLPDLFHGSQLVVLGQYKGSGHTSIKLKGKVGKDDKEFVFETSFPKKESDHDFVVTLWARRKVGYLLDQIRLHGENSELVGEVTQLAKKHGIATPYTSYLVVPDDRPAIAGQPLPAFRRSLSREADSFRLSESEARSPASAVPKGAEGLGDTQFGATRLSIGRALDGLNRDRGGVPTPSETRPEQLLRLEAGAEAVDVAQTLGRYKTAERIGGASIKSVGKRSFANYGGVWIDQSFKKEAETITVKYLSAAYFRIIERIADAKPVFALGSRVVWMTPSGKALIIDDTGKEELGDAEIDGLFAR